ncbi:hypothetical protein [Bradyrhizobium sp. 33ap4]|uniref:hypothetical protein n=1 Tax=Bradyrhizobium sp. 33ap4 TaxID=3061630 RepID=UPI00292DA9AD|nr:hypothetical protein [Bradyrhizobium sp. 33ap4]
MIGEIKAKIIKPARVVTPQCCAPVEPPTKATMWRRDRYLKLRPSFNPDACQRESTVEIDGKPYCRLHAGGLALDKWLKGELVEKGQS